MRGAVATLMTSEGVPPAIVGGCSVRAFAKQRAYALDFCEEDGVEDGGGWILLVWGGDDKQRGRQYDPAHTPCSGETPLLLWY